MLLYKSGFINCLNCEGAAEVDNFRFSDYTTYGLGGSATGAFAPASVYQAKYIYDKLSSTGKPLIILGNGSNVLASDKSFDGYVIVTRRMKGIVALGNNKVMCLAGTKISELLNYCKKRSLGGLEFMYGIPATVGGAAFMNAGVGSECIGDRISKVKLYDRRCVILNNKQCNFGYRHSTMRDIKGVITSISLDLEPSPPKEIEEKIAYYKTKRSRLPKGKSCGCVFKNPNGVSAGLLIDNAGLKGLSVGKAIVSDVHADFILNNGGSADDVRKLIDIVKFRVFQKFGVLLREEVVYIGDFNEFNG